MPGPDGPEAPLTFEQVLAQEDAVLGGKQRSALCISGGGIRSATFGLGVIEGLSKLGLLAKFDYLSTVSGGGYVGGWLTGWIHRHPRGIAGVMDDLNDWDAETSDYKSHSKSEPLIRPESDAVRHLRKYGNYLTPKLGALSADTWTGIGTRFAAGGSIGDEALLAEVTGYNPRDFGGHDLIAALNASVCARVSAGGNTSCAGAGNYTYATSVFDQALGIIAQLRGRWDEAEGWYWKTRPIHCS